MSLDYREFEKLCQSYRRIEQGFDNFMKEFTQEIGDRVLARAKRNTPVDTGMLRGKWEISNAYKDSSGWNIVIRNQMDYATYVEYGHTDRSRTKWVDGYFMCMVSVNEISKQIPRRFEKQFMEYVRSLGGA